ncbi:MAG: lycopene cyclase domain-containing protein [Actinomycetes bacterium]
MTYTALALLGVLVAVVCDVFIARTKLVTRRIFWVSYCIIFVFQLLSNGALTGFRIVRYSDAAIVGSATPVDHAPPMFGDGRLMFAPFEDILFGFSLVLFTLTMWVWLGRRGMQREPHAGPPHEIMQRILKRK